MSLVPFFLFFLFFSFLFLGTSGASPGPYFHEKVARPFNLVALCCLKVSLEETAMPITVEVLEVEALNLSVAERSRLVEKLILSLDTEPDVESAWAMEVAWRHAEIESGAVSLLPGAEALARLKAEFK
ncbi:MAG: addiction module protein [Candidatus Accumulibacter meliphilus]|uniref:addiction module protein n=1 Tax=Candidatus Accumulibacter meliphilus TaxID=2211374 RepID=UPI002FC2D1C5